MHCPACGDELLHSLTGDALRCRFCSKVYHQQGTSLVQVPDAEVVLQNARTRVDGVGIDVGAHGVFVDTPYARRRLMQRLNNWVERKIAGCLMSIVITVIMIATAAGVVWYLWSQRHDLGIVSGERPAGVMAAAEVPTTPIADPVPSDWDGRSPFLCTSGVHLIRNVQANLPHGTAVQALGGCQVVLDGVTIRAKVGIRATGNAVIEVRGGQIVGTDVAVSALGHARVTGSGGAKAEGKVEELGGATVMGFDAAKP